MNGLVSLIIFFLTFNFSCNSSNELFVLKGQLTVAYYKEEFKTVDSLFSLILEKDSSPDIEILKLGLKNLSRQSKINQLANVISNLSDKSIKALKLECMLDHTINRMLDSSNVDFIISLDTKLVEKLKIMLYNDQYVRGNKMNDILININKEENEILYDKSIDTDLLNQAKLDSILNQNLFSVETFGGIGLYAIFMITQHSPSIEFQEKLLKKFRKYCKKYSSSNTYVAYLQDRINIRKGMSQIYGTQILRIDDSSQKVEFYPIKCLKKVDDLRCKMGLIPIKSYEELVLMNN